MRRPTAATMPHFAPQAYSYRQAQYTETPQNHCVVGNKHTALIILISVTEYTFVYIYAKLLYTLGVHYGKIESNGSSKRSELSPHLRATVNCAC